MNWFKQAQKKESVVEAFIRQSNLDIERCLKEKGHTYIASDDGHIQVFNKDGDRIVIEGQTTRIYTRDGNTVVIDDGDKEAGEANLARALRENPMGASTNLLANSSLKVPTRLKQGELDQHSQSHPLMGKQSDPVEGRWGMIGGKGGGDGGAIEMN